MENKRSIIAKSPFESCSFTFGGKGKISYPSDITAERGNCLSVKWGGKALYIGNVAVTADAPVCRIGLESLPYPKQRCINVSTRLSVKKNTKEKSEVVS